MGIGADGMRMMGVRRSRCGIGGGRGRGRARGILLMWSGGRDDEIASVRGSAAVMLLLRCPVLGSIIALSLAAVRRICLVRIR